MTWQRNVPRWRWLVVGSAATHLGLGLIPVGQLRGEDVTPVGGAVRVPIPAPVKVSSRAVPEAPLPSRYAITPRPSSAPSSVSSGTSPVRVSERSEPPPTSSGPSPGRASDEPVDLRTGDLVDPSPDGGVAVRAGNTREEGFEETAVARGYAGGVLGGRGGGSGRGQGAGTPAIQGEGPSLIRSHQPVYPLRMVAGGVEGRVVLRILVSPTGRPARLEVVRGLHPTLDDLAMRAARRWRWRPATRGGKPVEEETTVAVVFRIDR